MKLDSRSLNKKNKENNINININKENLNNKGNEEIKDKQNIPDPFEGLK